MKVLALGLVLCAALSSACGSTTTTDSGGTTAAGPRGTTSVGKVTLGTSSSTTTGGTGTTTGGTHTVTGTTGGTGTTNGGSTGTGTTGTTTAGATTTAGTTTAGTTTGGGTTGFTLRVQMLGGAPGSVAVQNETSETLTFTADGNQAFSESYAANANFMITQVIPSHAHRACTWSADANQFSGADVHVTVSCVWQAVFVLGQQDFVSRGFNQNSGTVGANTMSSPTGNPTVGNGNVLYIADSDNHRILGYTSVPAASNANATFQMGQANFSQNSPHGNPNGFHAPGAVASNGAGFAVADTDNDRVVIYTTQPQQTGDANLLFSGPTDCASQGLYRTAAVAWGGTRLFIADTQAARVLIYNSVPTSSNQPADVILGQAGPSADGGQTHCSTPYPYTAAMVYRPRSIWTDGTRLLVTDPGFNRVMIWNTFPTVNNSPADVFVGQTGGAGFSQGANASGLTAPQGAIISGSRLFVADTTNHRVLYWNTVPTSNGQAADGVLGWATPRISSTQPAAPSASSLNSPTGVAVLGGYIFVVDTSNHRVLMFADDLD